MDVGPELEEALALLEPLGDVLRERPSRPEAPSWADARGWSEWLAALSEEELAAAEQAPAEWLAEHAPSDERGAPGLRAMAQRSAALTTRHRGERTAAEPARVRHVKERKRAQIEAFVAAAASYGEVPRVVDLGSGHGHLTRALAEHLRPGVAVGVEREARFVARARELGEAGPGGLGGRFVTADAEGFELAPGDLVVGLHPCGSLGDALVRRARSAGAHALMVSCCYQKIGTPERHGLSRIARGFAVPQSTLGLANLATSSFRGSGTMAAKQSWRRTRLAVRIALERRGVALAAGDEGRGVTKERFRAGLEAAAERAFERRGLPSPSGSELAEAAAEAERTHARIARFSLPRHALARVLELAIVLDRATYLAEAGWATEVRTLFPTEVSPRNLAILARAPR